MLNFAAINCNNILVLSTIDSTNNYAQSIVNAEPMPHNTIIQAMHQTAGRGQRNNTWLSEPNTNLMMSIIVGHQQSDLQSQFILNMAVCLGIVDCINTCITPKKCTIKWSNDIYVDDCKIAGILIENNIRGNKWTSSIIGIGVNINTQFFDKNLINPTSIFLQTRQQTDVELLRNKLVESINVQLDIAKNNPTTILANYNLYLYKKQEWQLFEHNNTIQKYQVKEVTAFGQIVLNNKEQDVAFSYGEIKQIIPSSV